MLPFATVSTPHCSYTKPAIRPSRSIFTGWMTAVRSILLGLAPRWKRRKILAFLLGLFVSRGAYKSRAYAKIGKNKGASLHYE